MIVAGIGFRAGCPAADIVALVTLAATRAGVTLTGLAAPDRKSDDPGLRQAAAVLGLPVRFIGAESLAAVEPRCPTRSVRAKAVTGAASVAEGCALAAAGEAGRLVLPRIASARATCALAEADAG